MYKAYFVTCPGKKTREIGRGQSKEDCFNNMKLSNYWQFIKYLVRSGITDFSEYVYITDEKDKVIFDTKQNSEVIV